MNRSNEGRLSPTLLQVLQPWLLLRNPLLLLQLLRKPCRGRRLSDRLTGDHAGEGDRGAAAATDAYLSEPCCSTIKLARARARARFVHEGPFIWCNNYGGQCPLEVPRKLNV